ncbi:MAG: valine--tRNA ligase, partial [Candidatus Omnitrophota bacterium]
PPNVTGILHMGHALNNTIQDILIRYHRMKGDESLWMPGTDHAGIATQNVVEKTLAKEGLKRQDLGRKKFIERVWQWRERYGSTIIRQLKKLGSSCDWQRTRFTMDEAYSKAVMEVFVRLFEKDLIYQGYYIINWCPRCQTALSDEEAPHRPMQGQLYYLRYPFKEVQSSGFRVQSKTKNKNQKIPEYIVVATTRPETMLGDTAVAVNPKDKRYKHLVGKTLILPLMNRPIRIIADTMVDMKFGTGAVKVTPAHDPNDYTLGKKHKLDFINIMYPDGRLNVNAGGYQDMDRFEAREVVLEDLKSKGLLEKVQPHELSAGHCYRCHTIIEPYLSKQWFVRMKPLSEPAIQAVKKGKISFHPKRWTKVYLNWMENIQDWCISRQIWWGHRIPVYYCKKCQETGKSQIQNPKGIIVSRVKPEKCPDCGSTDIYQDEDVLDTWFSSWLWPFATFAWPQDAQDLKYFYPTSVLVTAPEIIFFWVARMIMAGLEFMKDIPFKDVYIHGTVRDIEGKKMSKSLGNIIDPLDVIGVYGADALRFSLISITAVGQDVFLSKEKFEQGRNFANKIWNASRFILMNLDADAARPDMCVFFKKENLSLINRWILSRFYSVLKQVNRNLDHFQFNEAANTLYGFFWHEFCDWYLELVKPDIKNKHNQVVMFKILEKFLRALHPFMPFVTEELWHRLGESTSIMTQPYPHVQEQMCDKALEKEAQFLFDAITQIRNLRSSLEIKPEQKVNVSIFPHSKSKQTLLRVNQDLIIHLARLEDLNILEGGRRPAATISACLEDVDIYLHFSGLLDIEKEQHKIKEKIKDLERARSSKEARLKNSEFVKKAPQEIVLKERESIAEIQSTLKRLEHMSQELR